MPKLLALRLTLVKKVAEDMEGECCAIEQCNRKGTEFIALFPSDDLDRFPVYYEVCDLHYEELMSGYYKVSSASERKSYSTDFDAKIL